MRKISLLFLLVLSLFITGCSFGDFKKISDDEKSLVFKDEVYFGDSYEEILLELEIKKE
jgi:major membrane immunogen (membrane-anchored lipoprotein)